MRKPSGTRIAQAIGSALVVLALSLYVLPAYARAESLLAGERSESEIQELINRMLSSGDYVEGEAIVCFLPAADEGLTAQADLLAGAELLSQVTARQYAEATGEAVPAADETGVLTAQAEEEQVQVVLVRSQDVDTEGLLHELLADPRVLSAEPNYLGYLAEEDSDETSPDDPPTMVSVTDNEEVPTDASTDATVGEEEIALEPPEVEEVASELPNDEPEAEAEAEPEAEVEEALPESLETEPEPEEVSDDTEAPSITAQSDPARASQDLTGYQWSSVGASNAISQFPNWTNPGIKAPNWNTSDATNASGVVAIMDTGIDYTHPDLAGVMYHFSPELQAQLGCGEFGYAPLREDKADIRDGHDHGTHCAGIVAAEWNDFGVSGIANGVKLIGVAVPRTVESNGYTTESIVKGYDFLIRAAKAGVDIRAVNRSLIMPPATNTMDVLMQAAGELGIVSTVAAGNEAQDLETIFNDATYLQSNPYLLRVDASDRRDSKASFSNYGQNVTDLFAPGSAILSTIPTSLSGEHRYFASADSDPLFLRTDFDNNLMDVTPGTDVEQNLSVEGVSQAAFGADGDSSSLRVEVKATSGSTAELYLDVPAGPLNAGDVQDIVVAFSADRDYLGAVELGAVLENGKNVLDLEYRDKVTCENYVTTDGWCFAYLHISDPEGLGAFKQYVDAGNNTCVRLTLAFSLSSLSAQTGSAITSNIYLDQIAFGKPGNNAVLPYQYFSGTSMAAPAVAASAAIVSSTIDGVDPATRAATTVRMLKGAIHQAEGYAGYCKQNGQLDLSLLGQTDGLIPVIESASISGETLVIEGSNFSQPGTLTVGGKRAEVTSWSDDSIEATWPEGLTSGLIPITVKTDKGSQVCRAFILEAPEQLAGTVSVYERDLAPLQRADETSTMTCPHALIATNDGTLFAVAVDNDKGSEAPLVRCLMRSDDQGNSWAPVALPQILRTVTIAAGDGEVFVMGVQTDKAYELADSVLYRMDETTGTFTLLNSFDSDEMGINRSSILEYVNGRLYLASYRLDETFSEPSRLCVQRFSDDYKTATEPFVLSGEYPVYGLDGGVKAAVVGNSIYVLATVEDDPNGIRGGMSSLTAAAESKNTSVKFVGLERVDVAEDGALTSTNLSDTLVGIPEPGIDGEEIAMAASREGVFLVSSVLADQLPAGAERTDTFVLKPGATAFEPYTKTLSYARTTQPVAVCSPDGWLYACAISDYEVPTIFGRATKIATSPMPEPVPETEPEPKPEPEPEPTPGPNVPERDDQPSGGKESSSRVLPKTGDPFADNVPVMVTLILVGLACIAYGLWLNTSKTS